MADVGDGLKYQLVFKDQMISKAKSIRFDEGSEIKFSRVDRPQVVLNEKDEVIAILAACLPQDLGITRRWFAHCDLSCGSITARICFWAEGC
jgi:hypothetical protein